MASSTSGWGGSRLSESDVLRSMVRCVFLAGVWRCHVDLETPWRLMIFDVTLQRPPHTAATHSTPPGSSSTPPASLQRSRRSKPSGTQQRQKAPNSQWSEPPTDKAKSLHDRAHAVSHTPFEKSNVSYQLIPSRSRNYRNRENWAVWTCTVPYRLRVTQRPATPTANMTSRMHAHAGA